MILPIFLKYKFKRAFNKMSNGFRRKKKTDARVSTAKKKSSAVFLVFITVMLGFSVFNNFSITVGNAYQAHSFRPNDNPQAPFGYGCGDFDLEKSKKEREVKKIDCHRIANAPDSLVVPSFYNYMSIKFAILTLLAFLAIFLTVELASPEWDMEWLATMPVSTGALIRLRILERAVFNVTGYYLALPFTAVVLYNIGLSWPKIFLFSFFLYSVMMVLGACLQTIFDIGARMLMRPSHLKNLQALMSLATVLVGLSIFFREGDIKYFNDFSAHEGLFLRWWPPGLMSTLVTSTLPSEAAMAAVLLIVEAAAVVAATVASLDYLLKDGVSIHGAQDAMRSKLKKPRSERNSKTKMGFLKPIQRKEILLLMRDRTLMMQTLLAPVMMLGVQAYLGNTTAITTGSVFLVAAVAFGITIYAMNTSLFMITATESKTLWILSALPRSFEQIFIDKLKLWLVFLMGLPLAIFIYRYSLLGLVNPKVLTHFLFVELGVLIYSAIAVGMGYFAVDPFTDVPRQKISVTFVYLFMILGGFYTYALYAESYWTKLVMVLLTSFMAISLWQKMRDALPYFLDPTSAPPSRVSTSDGMIATLAFFVLQGVAALSITAKAKATPGPIVVFVAFAIAGFVVFALLQTIYFFYKTLDKPRIFGATWLQSSVMGVLLGCGVGCIALLYGRVVNAMGWFADYQASASKGGFSNYPVAVFLGIVVAAPIFEEYIFRGVIFGSLKRTWSLPAALLASAALFAVIHPPASAFPVFFLGLSAAYVYHRSGMLLGCMLLHATYNGIIYFTMMR